jgi:hypothetical protein
VPPITDGVPIYIHDYFGPGRHAKVVSTAATDLLEDGNKYREVATITGDESLAAEVTDIEWPDHILQPVDDEPPATIITAVTVQDHQWRVTGISHDNGDIKQVRVNGKPVQELSRQAGVVDWTITLDKLADKSITAETLDGAGNRELTPHVWPLP